MKNYDSLKQIVFKRVYMLDLTVGQGSRFIESYLKLCRSLQHSKFLTASDEFLVYSCIDKIFNSFRFDDLKILYKKIFNKDPSRFLRKSDLVRNFSPTYHFFPICPEYFRPKYFCRCKDFHMTGSDCNW